MNTQDKLRKQLYLRIKQLEPTAKNKVIRNAIEAELKSGGWDDEVEPKNPNAHKEEEAERFVQETIARAIVEVLQEEVSKI